MHCLSAAPQGIGFLWIYNRVWGNEFGLSKRMNGTVILIKLKPGDFVEAAFKT
jgi:hypothetical protein